MVIIKYYIYRITIIQDNNLIIVMRLLIGFRKVIRSLFFVCVILILSMCYIEFGKFNNSGLKGINVANTTKMVASTTKSDNNLKYILQWTAPQSVPFAYMGVGQKGFIDRNCPYVNCYVTSNRSYLGDYTKFDVIVFSAPDLAFKSTSSLPKKRSSHQKFVFASIESADYYPICMDFYNGFFNWTWTFRLDSEVKWGYISVRDADNNIIGPKKEMHWMKLEDMKPVSNAFKDKLKTKTKAAAWFVSNCYPKRNRDQVARDLKLALNKYNLTVDIYGRCGPLKCPRGEKEYECNKKIEKDYYFYLSFENSFDEDYVTEKLLTALQNNAVPIVFGGANYTRFMPDGIYLNVRELGVEKLAEKMNKLMHDIDDYAEYFRWKSHYTYYTIGETIETNEYCKFCSILNDSELLRKRSVYQNFKKWWNRSNQC